MNNQNAIMATITNNLIDIMKFEGIEFATRAERKNWIGQQLTNKTKFAINATKAALIKHG